ncbi:MAG: glycosyltransferase family 2 protein [Chloroflexi bacterium]|nr:glycosyltransferase family 2 protein [Chloroflexota bacterium]
MPLTAIVLTLDAARHVEECLGTLGWADERVVLDGGSRDGTRALALRAGARVHTRAFDTFARQRSYALALARGDWVFFVDADERVCAELAAEVRAGVADTTHRGLWVPRRNIILGGWVRHGGWYPDHQLRVLRRGYARYDERRPVHEVPSVAGSTGYVSAELLHLNYERLPDLWRKQWRYARQEALGLCWRAVPARPHSFVLQPAREFQRRYLALGGWRDGWRGLLLATAMAAATLATYCFLAQMQCDPRRARGAARPDPDATEERVAPRR